MSSKDGDKTVSQLCYTEKKLKNTEWEVVQSIRYLDTHHTTNDGWIENELK